MSNINTEENNKRKIILERIKRMMFEKDMSANIAMDELGIEKEEREKHISLCSLTALRKCKRQHSTGELFC